MSEKLFTDYIVPIIEEQCQPMLKIYKKTVKMYNYTEDVFFWRSTSLKNDAYEVKTRRKNRRPLNMDSGVQKALDKSFKKTQGWKPRSEGVFVTSYKNAQGYGTNQCMFFAIGKLDHLHSPDIDDLFIDAGRFDIDNENIVSSDRYDTLTKTYTKKDLIIGMKDENEFMFNCNKYLVVDEAYSNRMAQYLIRGE